MVPRYALYRISHTGDNQVPISYSNINNVFSRIFSTWGFEKAMDLHKKSRGISLTPLFCFPPQSIRSFCNKMAVQLQAKGDLLKKSETMHHKGCVLRAAAMLCISRSQRCDLSRCKHIVLFIRQNAVNFCCTMLEDEKFFGSYVVYYNTGKSCAGFKNNVWPSLCQDFIVFCTDF